MVNFQAKIPENSHKDFSGEYILMEKFKVTISYEQSFILLILVLRIPLLKSNVIEKVKL